jgi:hypothetical protein
VLSRLVRVRGLAWKLAIPAASLAVVGQFALSGTASSATQTVAAVHHVAVIKVHKNNMLDCNTTQIRRLCTDPHGHGTKGDMYRFVDPKTHAYVGHDEPSVKFISSANGSGNTMTYGMQLSTDPSKTPTATGSVTQYGELSVAPWFGLPICDSQSYPQNPCTPLSDSNSGGISDTGAAGSAFMELQFYPPGFTPFIDSTSCSKTQWCAALTIDSLECTFNFATCNSGCVEPVNFSFLQTNGVPPGPPAPQDPTASTFLGDSHTLKMNPGDVLKVSISNVADSGVPDVGGLKASVTDVTTGQTGYIVASAKNGFAQSQGIQGPADCSGIPHSFHAEYNSAQQQNQVPWAALEGGVLMEQEIGHGESCSSVSSKLGFATSYSDGSSYVDPKLYQVCNGGTEGRGKKGEGPCNINTGNCQHATTQGKTGPKACPVKNAGTGALCEFSDANCFPKGSRPVLLNGLPATENASVAICYQGTFQNGDLDFDGNSYRADWPNGSGNFPTPMRFVGPFTNGGTYPKIQFETDALGSEGLCNVNTGHNCTTPPLGSKFYPFWTMNNTQTLSGLSGKGVCVWNFGNVISHVTTKNFGKAGQYGAPDLARYGGTATSKVINNPEFASGCAAVSF